MYIAEEGIKAKLPSNWKSYLNSENSIFYKNIKTGYSTFEHPLDNYYRQKFKDTRRMYHTSNHHII